MARPSTERTSEPRAQDRSFDLDLGIFSFGGPFAGYSGPALVVGPNCVILAANDAAGDLATLIKKGALPDLRTAIDTALSGHAAQVNPLLIAGDDGRPACALDVSALPWGEGAAALVLARDVTLERTLRKALVEEYQRYKDILGLLDNDFAWEVNAEAVFVFVSPNGALGYPPGRLLGTGVGEFAVDTASARAFASRDEVAGQTVNLRCRDGGTARMDLSAVPLWDGAGEWAGARGLCRLSAP